MKIEMPRGWEEITIKQYQELVKILENQDKENALEVEVGVIKCLANVTDEDLDKLSVPEFNKLSTELSKWMSGKVIFNTKIKPSKVGTIHGSNSWYKVQYDVNKWTAAQYIDFQQLYNKPELLTSLLATFLIPVDKKVYNQGYDALEVAKDLEDLDIATALSVQFFFLKLWGSSIEATATCLAHRKGKTKEETKMIQKLGREMVTLIKGMCGCPWYQQYLTQPN